jgi:ketosteroid isomerase-like protein
MDRSRIETLVKQAYSARDAGHAESVMETFSLDASFGLAGDRDVLHVTGTVRGHPEIRGSIDSLIQTFEFMEREVLDVLIDGSRAAVRCRVKLRFIPTDAVFTTELLDLFKCEDDKIVDLVEFADTALIKHLISKAV